ncbi:Zinc finger, CCHC domain-containing protein [Homalodisca vitripennis]|nr:Zinc finger, CCHC domain-containing protein [Homalodisca vitripennis]
MDYTNHISTTSSRCCEKRIDEPEQDTALAPSTSKLDIKIDKSTRIMPWKVDMHSFDDAKMPSNDRRRFPFPLRRRNCRLHGTQPAVLPCLQLDFPQKFRHDQEIHDINMLETLELRASSNTQTLGELLLQFFHYYNNFKKSHLPPLVLCSSLMLDSPVIVGELLHISISEPVIGKLKGDLRTTTNGRIGWLLARTGSLSGHPSKQQPRSTLLDPFLVGNCLLFRLELKSQQPLAVFDESHYGEDAISVRLGSTLPIERCRRFPSPKNEPRAWTYLCIEEPFDHTNTARSVYDQEKFEHIRKVFAVSYQRLHDTLSLDSIFHLRVA